MRERVSERVMREAHQVGQSEGEGEPADAVGEGTREQVEDGERLAEDDA